MLDFKTFVQTSIFIAETIDILKMDKVVFSTDI